MQLTRLVVRGFRNLADLDVPIPGGGMAIVGPNGQGKTNLLEALCYTVLCRSVRGAADAELVRFGGTGFHVASTAGSHEVMAQWTVADRRKRVVVDGVDQTRLSHAIGRWLAVAFLPGDVALASGPASVRRLFLDRLLALADGSYLEALSRYRAGLAQRNRALRLGRGDLASAFDSPLAAAGAEVVAARIGWVGRTAGGFGTELAALGEPGQPSLEYRGRAELAEAEAWTPLLQETLSRDLARGMTGTGPHRDDLRLTLEGRELRTFGSTGQQRSAAIALRLLELDTLASARGTEPALALDDVFAELDAGRQERLAARLLGSRRHQVFLTAPRLEELPASLNLPLWRLEDGRILA